MTFEPLEPRTLLSGSVTAAVVDGSLVLRGDKGDNALIIEVEPAEVSAAAPGAAVSVFVRAADETTTINGEGLVVMEVTKDLRVSLGGGNDSLRIEAVDLPRDLRIDSGAGDDTVTLDETGVARGLRLLTRG